MTIRTFFAAAAATLVLALPAVAQEHPEGIHVHDVYARSGGMMGGSGAIFFMMHNNTETDDRLIAAAAPVAERVELHTHIEDENGVMQMREIEGGIAMAAGDMHEMARGGDHVMLMGLTAELKDGDTFPLTLTFEQAGEVTVEVVVDNARKPDAGHDMNHDGHDMNHDGHDMKGMEEGNAGHDHDAHQQAAHQHGADQHGAHGAVASLDQTGMADPDAVVAVMKAQFDTPENPLTVDPVVIDGPYALASWAQGDKGGRALLRKADMGWEIVMCGGEDLRMPAFLTQHGVTRADTLSQMFNAAEDDLGAEKVALYSSFEGVVMIAGH
jgi:periplasmic copper chaperone A